MLIQFYDSTFVFSYACRLDMLNISVDMNSRRKNRLMIENLRKISRSYSGTNVPTLPDSDSTSFGKVSLIIVDSLNLILVLRKSYRVEDKFGLGLKNQIYAFQANFI